MAANVIGRRVFDMTNGWNGKPAAGEHVFVVTHRPPTDWEYADTAPFTFVDGIEKAAGRAAAAGEPDHDRARRPGHAPGLRRQPPRLAEPSVVGCPPRGRSALSILDHPFGTRTC